MERVFGLLVIVAILFVGIELYTKGDQAFGGMFASADAPAAEDDASWAGDRAGARLREGHDERADRMERALGEQRVRQQPGCIFCHIVRGEAPCDRVYEDEHVLAFMDLFPAEEGHVLVIPREHFANLYETPAESLRRVITLARRVAPALREVVKPAGLRVVQLNGEAAGQTVFHYHLHLIPCGADGAMRVHGRSRGDPARLSALAAAIAVRVEASNAV